MNGTTEGYWVFDAASGDNELLLLYESGLCGVQYQDVIVFNTKTLSATQYNSGLEPNACEYIGPGYYQCPDNNETIREV